MKLFSDYFLQGSNINNYQKIILKFVFLFIAFARPDTILPIVREITLLKSMILESNLECAKHQFARTYMYSCNGFPRIIDINI